jgi:DNA-binding NarL/FixJ family response regulator
MSCNLRVVIDADSTDEALRSHRGRPDEVMGLAPYPGAAAASMMDAVPCTVLIVDDQDFMRGLLRQLAEDCGLVVVGEVGDEAGALEAAAELEPDVILLDVQLGDGSGIEVARVLSAWPRRPTIVLISTVDYGAAARSCGADAFVQKGDLSRRSLLAAIGQ